MNISTKHQEVAKAFAKHLESESQKDQPKMSEKQYRDLEVGEYPLKGDEHKSNGSIRKLEIDLCIAVQPDEAGDFRRPITSAPEGETCEHGRLYTDCCEQCVRLGMIKKSSPTTEPVVTERHRKCAKALFNSSWDALTILAKHFPEPASDRDEVIAQFDKDRIAQLEQERAEFRDKYQRLKRQPESSDWIERAAEEINVKAVDCYFRHYVIPAEDVAAIIARHMKGEGA